MYIYICCIYMLGSIAYNEDIVNNDHQQTNVVLLGKMKSELQQARFDHRKVFIIIIIIYLLVGC